MLRRTSLLTIIVCTLLAAVFAWLSYSAILTKAATLDEPLHTASAYTATYLGDYRLDPENPPLWKYWVAIPMRRGSFSFDSANPNWCGATEVVPALTFARESLYHSSVNDGPALIDATRGAMVLLGVIVLALSAWWAYRLAGAAAAVVVAVLIAFDPTFLAHAAIMKNDVAMTLLMLVLVIVLFRAMNRLTVLNVALIALACAAAINVKFSGLLWPIIAVIALLLRVRTRRVWKTAAAILAIAVTCFAMTWASYRFRYSVAPDPSVGFDLPRIVSQAATRQLTSSLGRPPTPDELTNWRPPLIVKAALFIDRHHLLPQAWSAGLLGTYRAAVAHQNYLLGEVRDRGWWYYFPLAILFKTPLATLIAAAFAVAMLAIPRLRDKLQLNDDVHRFFLAAAVAGAIYLLAAMSQNIDHGVRHMLPIFPLIFVTIAIVFARLRNRAATWLAAILALILAAESLAAFPNYLPFFNLAAGGSRGGFRLLGDSNLDWGQDLTLIANWRRAHPHENLYLFYYGTADPLSYGVDPLNRPGGIELGASSPPGVVAVSATRLQGLYMTPEMRRAYQQMQSWPLREVLGGTIYLFDYPPRKKEGGPTSPPSSNPN